MKILNFLSNFFVLLYRYITNTVIFLLSVCFMVYLIVCEKDLPDRILIIVFGCVLLLITTFTAYVMTRLDELKKQKEDGSEMIKKMHGKLILPVRDEELETPDGTELGMFRTYWARIKER